MSPDPKAHICHLFSKALSSAEQRCPDGRDGPGVWEPRTDCALSPSSLEEQIDLDSKRGFAFKEVERLVGALAEKLALISSGSRGQIVYELLSDCVRTVAQE